MSGFGSTALGRILAQSAAPVSHTGDTAEFTFATITIPANSLGANGRVQVIAQLTIPGNTNSKTARIRFGGTQICAGTTSSAGSVGIDIMGMVANRGATNSQSFRAGSAVLGASASASATAAVDTTADVSLTITGQLGVGTDTITLESYQVILYPKG